MNIKSAAKDLEKILGNGKLHTENDFLHSYSYDATGIKRKPGIVIFPENESDIKKILKIASEYKLPVTPRGGGVGYSGGSIPFRGGIVIAFSRMNRILEINGDNRYAVVEPGVVTGDLIRECETRGFFYPPDPASLKNSTIGGNVAENAGGPRCFKYGVTSDYVMRVEGFLVNGQKVGFGSLSVKDVAGYNMKGLIAGSEGTLILLSKIVLRIIPGPEERALLRIGLGSLRDGTELIRRIIDLNVSPSAMEFLDRSSLEAVNDYMNTGTNDGVNSIVLLELDGTREEIEKKAAIVRQLGPEFKVKSLKIANTESEMDQLWTIRRNLSPAIAKVKPLKINEDISVPPGKVPDTVDYISELGEKYKIRIIMFGHLGDGNIHTNIMIDPSQKNELKASGEILERMFKYVIAAGGSLSGEHGIGLTKKKFLKFQYNKTEIDLFRAVKKAFDPENRLNPGKIF